MLRSAEHYRPIHVVSAPSASVVVRRYGISEWAQWIATDILVRWGQTVVGEVWEEQKLIPHARIVTAPIPMFGVLRKSILISSCAMLSRTETWCFASMCPIEVAHTNRTTTEDGFCSLQEREPLDWLFWLTYFKMPPMRCGHMPAMYGNLRGWENKRVVVDEF